MNKEQFINELKQLKIICTEENLEKLNLFYLFLIKWNKKINLTTIIEEESVYLKHFYDSLTATKIVDFNNVEFVLDVGTGAGFPGIILKIFYPHLKLTLVDSLLKRVNYLKLVIEELSLSDINVIHSRIEDLNKVTKTKYDIVISRALAKMPILIMWLTPYISKTGKIICMKANVEEELKQSQDVLVANHLKISNIMSFHLPYEESIRNLIEISKIN
ncbi:MAG: 16S rRNA (guanine(527)-N(7))-methyltransferase RsmG [Tenericutes bacterium]|jgi:16S rRNA (guanine527-N7)-methyltransferase|nr:16S rRNA (guanine(527)-N(7))-methyltransferase RsmG [Mycoplasmatota bacterium]